MFKRLLLSSLFLIAALSGVKAQVTIISPTTNNGGFESATAGPWQIVNGSQTNKWILGTNATTGFIGSKSAYVSNGTGTGPAHTYTLGSSSSVFLYQDVTLPAGYPSLTLTFKAIQRGQSDKDQAIVYMSTGTPGAAPVAGTATGTISTYPPLAGYQQLFLVPVQTTASWTTYTVTIPASLGNNTSSSITRRLMFRWVNDASGGVNPPIGLDDVTLTGVCNGPVVFLTDQTTSTTTLNWNSIPGATTYTVRYRLSTDPTTVPTWATPTIVSGTSFSLTGLNSDATYIYEIVAVNGSCTTPTTGTFFVPCLVASLPYSENFESITSNNSLPTCMKGITLGTDVLSYINNQGNNRINHTPGGSKFVSFRYSNNNRYLFTPAFDLDSSVTYKLSFWYIADGASGFDSLQAVIATSPTAAGVTVRGNAIVNVNNTTYRQYTTQIKPTTNGVQYFGIYVKGTSSPFYLTVDDININQLAPCTGTPVIGAITGVSSICAGQPFTLDANGFNANISGTSLQWQSANTCTGPWTDIAGETDVTYTASAGLTISRAYRVVITCANSGLSAPSPCFPVTVTPFYNCYCNSAAGNAVNEDIAQVQIGGFFTNPTTSPAPPITSNPLANATYTDYTSLAPLQFVQGSTYSLDVTQYSSATVGSNNLKAFIDYNHNSLMTDAGETVATIASPANNINSPSHTGSITIPATAQVGITRMRLVLARTASAASITPCATYGSGETEDYLVEITGTPVPPLLTNSGPICGGDTVTIIAAANILTSSTANAALYTLTGPGIPTLTNTTGIFQFQVPRAVTSARYTATVKAYGITSDTISTNVIVYPNPATTLGSVTNPTTCAGNDGSIQINNLGNAITYSLKYRRNGVQVTLASITSDASGSYVISGLTVGTYDSIRIVNTNGCRNNFLGPVSLVAPGAPATPTATSNSPLCLSSSLNLTVQNPDPAGTYNWFGPNGFSATGVSATRNNLSYADTGRYYVTVTIAGCTSLPRAIRTFITSPSAAPTALPQSFCQNSAATPLVAFGSGLLFYATETGGTGVPSLSPNATTVGNFTYYVTQNTTGCPSIPRTPISVTISPQPAMPLLPYDTVLYCQFESSTALLAYGSNPKFYASATGGIGATSLTPSTNVPGTFTYYATQTSGGCESRRSPITVIVNPKPAPPTVSSPLNICQYTTPLPLTAIGQDLKWYDVPTGGTGVSTPPSPPTGYEATLTYYVVQTLDGCESDRVALQVNVNYAPNATFVPSKQYVCVADTISFIYFGNARLDAKYYWTIPSPTGQPVSGLNTQGPFVARFNSVGTYQVRLVVDNKGCVSSPVYQSFEVRPRPDVRITGKREICIDEVTELTLDSISDNISNYNWTFGDGTVVYGTQNTGPYGVKWSTPGIKEVIVKTVSRLCGSFDRKEFINVHPAPAAFIRNKPTAPVCSGDSIRLQANDLGPGYSYQWTPAVLFQKDETAGTTVWAIAANGNTSTNIELTVTDSIGCEGKDYLSLTTGSCCKVAFPNAFTPNGDRTNDVFSMITNGNPQISSFRIYNRIGNMVFETANSLQGWDGTYMSEPQPLGVYVYYVKYRCDGRDFEQKGEITLIR